MKTLLVFVTRLFLTLVSIGLAIWCMYVIVEIRSNDYTAFEATAAIMFSGIGAWYIGKPQWDWWKKFLSED